jgi:phosphotransferase system IIB component
MKIYDIFSGNVRLEVDLKVDGPPPTLQVDVCGWHNYSDHISNIFLDLIAKVSGIPLGSASTVVALQPSPRRVCSTLLIPISSDLVRLVEEVRKDGDVNVELSATCHYLGLPLPPYAPAPTVAGPISYTDVFTISLNAWKNALGLRDFEPLLVSKSSINRLEELRRKWGLFTYEDVITRFIDLYEGVKLERPYELLFTDPPAGVKTIKTRLGALVESGVWSEVDVVSLYLDQGGAEYLVKLRERGTRVRLITRKPNKKAHEDALKTLGEKGVELRVNNVVHCRLIVFDEEVAIISTADLDAEGLDNQRQIGVYITDRATVKQCKIFFYKLWEESQVQSS